MQRQEVSDDVGQSFGAENSLVQGNYFVKTLNFQRRTAQSGAFDRRDPSEDVGLGDWPRTPTTQVNPSKVDNAALMMTLRYAVQTVQ